MKKCVIDGEEAEVFQDWAKEETYLVFVEKIEDKYFSRYYE